MTGIHSFEDSHLTDELAAAWLDRELVGEEKDRVAEHLAVCGRCREELAEVRRLLEPRATGRARSRRGLRFLVPAAAAAAVILWVAGPVPRDDAERIRGDSSPSAGTADAVTIIAPVEGLVDAEVPRFVWHAAGDGVQFTLTLTDVAGSVVWTTATQDTATTLPASVRLARGREYFWYVDALLASGETATSGVQRFETAP